MTAAGISVVWTVRVEPLHPAAVLASGDTVPALAAATANGLSGTTSLRAAHAPGWLLVTGSGDELPWADGAVYLGFEAGLLVPTVQEPTPGAAFLAAALPPAPLRAVLPGLVLTAPLPARAPDAHQLDGMR